VNVSRAERVGSSALGTLLLAAGASRRSIGGAAAGLLGGALLYRGLSGHCHVYQALRFSTADDERTAPAQSRQETPYVRRTVTIDRPAETLYDLWRDPQKFQKIMAFFAQTRIASDGSTEWTVRTPIGKVFECATRIVGDRRVSGWSGSRARIRGFAITDRFDSPTPQASVALWSRSSSSSSRTGANSHGALPECCASCRHDRVQSAAAVQESR
jgi:uncharacterized membrane protein